MPSLLPSKPAEALRSVTAVAAPRLSKDIDDLLANMPDLDASDLHLLANLPPLYRMPDSRVVRADGITALTGAEILECIRTIVRDEERLALYENSGDLDMVYVSGGRRFRLNLYRAMGKPALCARHIKSRVPKFVDLGLPDIVQEMANARNGLLLITGPTGSGKSTTLASIIEYINERKNLHIITLEDPVEYVFSSKQAIIHQREVGSDTNSFAGALRQCLRQDPDVIMVGEMRDLETIGAAITAAETGHFVLATLHTKDAPGTVDRIIDVFPPHQQQQIRVQLSNILVGICCQQIMTTTMGTRTIATEVMSGTTAVRSIIREGKTEQLKNTILTASEQGMHLFEQDLARMVKKRIISLATAEEYSHDPASLAQFLERAGISGSRREGNNPADGTRKGGGLFRPSES